MTPSSHWVEASQALSVARPSRRLNVSIVTGPLTPRDAIANVVMQHVHALSRFGKAVGAPMDIRLYSGEGTTIRDSRLTRVHSPVRVAADEHFQRSDLIVHHFGIYHPLFDAIHFAPRTARVAVVFYGVTPPAMVTAAVQPAIYESYRQAANLLAADRVIVTSRRLAEEARRMGVPEERIRQIPLSSSIANNRGVQVKDPRQPPVFAYLGRFVRSKGVMDLLQAAAALVGQGATLRLELMGSLQWSDREYVASLEHFCRESPLRDSATFHFDLPDDQVAARLDAADALVIPSYHEGFCVPVVEALGAGCFVIVTDAGALPETSGGLGRTYPAGDVDALADRLATFIEARRHGKALTDTGEYLWEQWRRIVKQYAAKFTRQHCDAATVRTLLEDLTPAPIETRDHLAEARRRAIAPLAPQGAERLIPPKFRFAVEDTLDDASHNGQALLFGQDAVAA